MKSKLQTLRDLLYERDMNLNKETVFSEKEAPLSIDDKKALAANLAEFSNMAETLRARGQRLEEAVSRITKMVETANRMIQESDDDMVEKVAAGRHMKMVEMALKEMQKSASEVMIHERRMEAACEDIREGLSKYYEVR